MPTSPSGSQRRIELQKKRREVKKLELEIADLSRSRRRFIWGSIVVPLSVAFSTLAVFWITGFFDTHEKMIEIAKHDFKEDTIAYSIKKRQNEYEILSTRASLVRLEDSLLSSRAKLSSYDSLLKIIRKSSTGKEVIILNLEDQNKVLQQSLTQEQKRSRIVSDSIKYWSSIYDQTVNHYGDINEKMQWEISLDRGMLKDYSAQITLLQDSIAKLNRK